MSNSKLTPWEKNFLQVFKKKRPKVQFFSFPEAGVTVAICATGEGMADFSLSIASNSEQKFRRKVGEYYAAMRMNESAYLPTQVYDTLENAARRIAQAVVF